MIIKTIKEDSKLFKYFTEAGEKKINIDSTKINKKVDKELTDYSESDDNISMPEDNSDDEADDYDEDVEATDITPPTDDENEEEVSDDYSSSNGEDQPVDTAEDQSGEDEATDYSDDTGDDVPTEDGMNDQDNQEQNEDEDNSLRKYNLYDDFTNLYDHIKEYITSLEDIVKDSIDANMVLFTVTKKLREIQSLLKEYILIKFNDDEYNDALYFYNSIVEAVALTFELLKNNEIILKH